MMSSCRNLVAAGSNYPEQLPNISYGIAQPLPVLDGDEPKVGYLQTPTPGTQNVSRRRSIRRFRRRHDIQRRPRLLQRTRKSWTLLATHQAQRLFTRPTPAHRHWKTVSKCRLLVPKFSPSSRCLSQRPPRFEPRLLSLTISPPMSIRTLTYLSTK